MHRMRKNKALLIAAVLLLLTGCGTKEVTPDQSSESSAVNSTFQVTFLDVGKGDCILIEKDGSAVLIDCGYKDTAAEVITALQNKGITEIHCMIITHYDKDHVGGAAEIAAAFKVGLVCLPDYETDSGRYEKLMEVMEEKDIEYQRISKDVSFTLKDAEYKIYASDIAYEPETESEEGNDNDVSLIVTAENGKDTYLFAGDLEKKGIKAYLADDHGTYDVVKMPHHGKEESNSDDFIEEVSPKIAVITDSAEEPAEDTLLALLTEAGADVYRSSINGTVVITSSGTGEYKVTAEHE